MPATSAVLTGLSLATGIAREATDGVPIVKQVLGVASRIVDLAEKVDKNREDLHALADRAKNMDATITDITGDRELDHRLLRRLEDMNRVLRAVEKHFEKHIQQGRVQKTLGYIFTVRKEVDRLRGEFDDRLRELEVAASLDTNLSAKRDAKFNGEFRNIRHCEIDFLRRITPRDLPGRGYTVNCHLATCDGSNQVVVVREIVTARQDGHVRRHLGAHDDLLERMSLVQNRHPNIAYLYGRNTGPKENRFVVLKAGDIRLLDDVLNGHGPGEISFIGRIVAKLVDASCHLQKYGAAWEHLTRRTSNLYVDNNYEPKIGIEDDLYTVQANPVDHARETKLTMGEILGYYGARLHSQETEGPRVHFKSTLWSIELFGALIGAGYRTCSTDMVFRRADIPRLIPLDQESRMYLRQSDSRYQPERPYWNNTLLHLAIGAGKLEGSFLCALYHTPGPWSQHETICVLCIEDTVDAVYHSTDYFGIPRSAVNEVRQRLGIPASNDQDWRYQRFYLQRVMGSSATSMECTGWREGFPSRHLW